MSVQNRTRPAQFGSNFARGSHGKQICVCAMIDRCLMNQAIITKSGQVYNGRLALMRRDVTANDFLRARAQHSGNRSSI